MQPEFPRELASSVQRQQLLKHAGLRASTVAGVPQLPVFQTKGARTNAGPEQIT
jgi:hypothetical protein